jgi:hypothetical protein
MEAKTFFPEMLQFHFVPTRLIAHDDVSALRRCETVTFCIKFHNILSTAPQLSNSQKALGTLPEDGNVMPKHVGATIHN